jgi:phospholipid transport system substrate-binding protein
MPQPLLALLLALALAWASGARAVEDGGAHTLVEEATGQVMDVVIAADAYVDEDPERYYDQVQSILEPLIDYRSFARGVMGPYATSKRYRSLDDAGKAELAGQLDRFTEVMRLSLVRTYSKGLLAFGGSRIEVVPPEDSEGEASRVWVRQHVYADRAEPYVVLYRMGRNRAGEWKLLNVIIESVNLGDIYRDQFITSAREEQGDLDAVIAGWTTVTVDVET